MSSTLIVDNEAFFSAASQELLAGNSVRFQLKGNSMSPFLKDGQKILLTQIDPKKTRMGEIVLAKWKNNFVLHRIIYQNKQAVFLAGDHNLFQIEKVDRVNLIAKIEGSFNQKKLQKLGLLNRSIGLCWFILRPIRWIFTGIKRKLSVYKK